MARNTSIEGNNTLVKLASRCVAVCPRFWATYSAEKKEALSLWFAVLHVLFVGTIRASR